MQEDTSVGHEGYIHTWDEFSTVHSAMAHTDMEFGDFFESILAKFFLANDVPREKKNCYMAILAFQGDPRNVGLVNDDKDRFETMKTDSGKVLYHKILLFNIFMLILST